MRQIDFKYFWYRPTVIFEFFWGGGGNFVVNLTFSLHQLSLPQHLSLVLLLLPSSLLHYTPPLLLNINPPFLRIFCTHNHLPVPSLFLLTCMSVVSASMSLSPNCPLLSLISSYSLPIPMWFHVCVSAYRSTPIIPVWLPIELVILVCHWETKYLGYLSVANDPLKISK